MKVINKLKKAFNVLYKGLMYLKSRVVAGIMQLSYGRIATIAVIFGVAAGIVWAVSTQEAQGAFGGDIIRLHVIANSDSEGDQALKLKVRDSILAGSARELANINDGKAARDIISAGLKNIETAARDELKRQGSSYAVNAQWGVFDFPVRQYGDITLPAGKYRAVRVLIGEGRGKNWWCVMYPPLCFVDATHANVPEKSKRIIAQSLASGGNDIINGKQNTPQLEVRFKLLELLGWYNKPQKT